MIATPGPWEIRPWFDGKACIVKTDDLGVVTLVIAKVEDTCDSEDAIDIASVPVLKSQLVEQRRRADRLDDAIKWIRDLHEVWHQRWLATDRRGTVSGVSTSLLASVLERIDSALADGNRRTPSPATADLLEWLADNPEDYGIQACRYGILVLLKAFAAEWSAPPAPVLDEHRALLPGTTGEATCGHSSED